jgi:NAD(P)-dependent dehydrogenase (short-subunit alcohol dehydrogenase family)
VTGASSGLGLRTATVLASAGATVVLGCCDRAKAEAAAGLIASGAGAGPRVVQIDLASLASVHSAAATIRSSCRRLDLLVNNAGVMQVPHQRTEDGFELTLASTTSGISPSPGCCSTTCCVRPDPGSSP